MSTKIEWTDTVWNPVVGCTRVSEGCRHCYAERMAKRLRAMGLPQYQDVVTDAGRWTGQLRLDEAALLKPLRWRKPRRVFVNSMSDLFHEGVHQSWIHEILHVIKQCPQHTFQILTKRPERMLKIEWRCATYGEDYTALPNIWLGVSVEDQATADARIPWLLQTPAAVRFVSYEPALGPVAWTASDADTYYQDWLSGEYHTAREKGWKAKLDWVIMGGESGLGARPMHPDWARNTRDACFIAMVPFFFKQWGGVHKADMGALLDGREWREWPS